MTSDPELVSMTQQYTQAHSGEYVAHLAYEEINRQVAAGRPWSKCQNCGTPYPMDKEGVSSSGIHCSDSCYNAALADLMNPRGAFDFLQEE